MTVWRPPTQEIDPLLEAVVSAARATILPTASIDTPPPSSEGVRAVRLRNGQELRLMLSAQHLEQKQSGVRQVVVYAVNGNAVVDNKNGYRITGQAILDTVTRAFLDVDCRIESVGTVTL
jgi:hypothetical protein